MAVPLHCILCQSPDTTLVLQDDVLFSYHGCNVCKLYFAEPGQRLPPSVEKSRYDHHENDPRDPNYRIFLDQLFLPLNKLIPENSQGLDYGSGPGPTLHKMFEKSGHSVNIYDPFYAHHPDVLSSSYDFITATETAEHFFNPRREFDLLWNLLKPNGYLGIMTKFLTDPAQFENWFYRKDDTHVTFYQKETFNWLAGHLNAHITFHGDRVCILKKLKNH